MPDVARDDGVQLAADGGGEAHAVRGERERRAAGVLDDGQDVVSDRCEWSSSTAVSIGTNEYRNEVARRVLTLDGLLYPVDDGGDLAADGRDLAADLGGDCVRKRGEGLVVGKEGRLRTRARTHEGRRCRLQNAVSLVVSCLVWGPRGLTSLCLVHGGAVGEESHRGEGVEESSDEGSAKHG